MSSQIPPGPRTAPLETSSWGRRVLALIIDWIASLAVTVVIVGASGFSEQAGTNWITLLVFWAESSIGVAVAGASFGQLLTRIRVLRVGGRPLSLFRAILRQALVCLVIPPLVFKPDGRGLHDLWTDSAAYSLQ